MKKFKLTSSSNYPKLSYSLREKCSNAELKSRFPCQTLSKNFDISRKMPCTSSEGFTSKALYIPCIIKRTDTHESFGWNPDWLLFRRSLSSKNFKGELVFFPEGFLLNWQR